jgi:hypothetical protein
MRRELRRSRRRLAARELLGEPRVHLLALAREQRRVDRLGEQRVAEAKAPRRVVPEQDAVSTALRSESRTSPSGSRAAARSSG